LRNTIPVRKGAPRRSRPSLTRKKRQPAPAPPPLLRAALDEKRMEAPLRELLQPELGTSAAGARIASARLITAKGGKRRRALVAYNVESRAEGERIRVLGKHFHDVAQARRVYRSLSVGRKACGSTFMLPQPLGVLPELSMVVYLPVAGRPLDQTMPGSRTATALSRAAKCLARLHDSRLSLDRQLDVGCELVTVQRWAEVVAARMPELGETTLGLSQRLREVASQTAFELGVPIHKDLHYGHIVDGPRLGVLDFDEMRLGDPSFDLAHFCAYLHLLGSRTGIPRALVERLEQTFLTEYARRSGWRRDERFACFAVYASLKIGAQLCAEGGPEPRPTGLERRRQLLAILEYGHAFDRALR
jgi:aminoglycoside phosphotransferase (APT) family kinase protein